MTLLQPFSTQAGLGCLYAFRCPHVVDESQADAPWPPAGPLAMTFCHPGPWNFDHCMSRWPLSASPDGASCICGGLATHRSLPFCRPLYNYVWPLCSWIYTLTHSKNHSPPPTPPPQPPSFEGTSPCCCCSEYYNTFKYDVLIKWNTSIAPWLGIILQNTPFDFISFLKI